MTSPFSVALLCAVVLAVAGTVSMFVDRGRSLWFPPGLRAGAAGSLVGLLTLATAGAVGLPPASATLVAAGLTAAVLVWGRAGRDWTLRGQVAWSMAIAAGALYLAWIGAWTLAADLTAPERTGALVLLLLEAFVFLLALGHVWELVDVLARRRWRRRVVPVADAAHRPFVSLHVPTHNEPPDLVIETLECLLAQEYDDFEVLLLDNNTDDPALWRPVEEFCREHERIRFFHLADWPGYKSGALNFGLERTDPRAELVGVVDADYHAEPDFLARCAPLFADDTLGFLQTPQDYRAWEFSGYFRRLYHSYKYFFDVSQVSRNERAAPIFGGTMGLIRRRALVEAGGWDEWCITEDAELSLRLLRDGWSGLHVEETFGRGMMPLSFEALKRQRFRWCLGGVQILRLHWRTLLPGRRTATNAMGLGQRWAFLVGGLQWFGDVAALAFTGFLVLGALDLAGGGGLVVRRLGPMLLLCVLALVLLGALRSVALLHRVGGTGWRDSFGAFGIWLALGWSVALGAVRGLTAREGAFLRTPKVREEAGWRDVLRANRVEALLALTCIAAASWALSRPGWGALTVATLLLVQGAGYAAAPWNSFAALRSWLPEDLRRRRRDGLRSWTRRTQPVRLGGLVIGAATAFLLAFVVFAAPLGGRLPDLPGATADSGGGPTDRPTVDRRGPTGPESTDGGTPVTAGIPSPGTTRAAAPGTPSAPGTTRAPAPATSAELPSQAPGSTAATQPTQPPSTRPSPTRSPSATPSRPVAPTTPTSKP